jgi:hypothetical protein
MGRPGDPSEREDPSKEGFELSKMRGYPPKNLFLWDLLNRKIWYLRKPMEVLRSLDDPCQRPCEGLSQRFDRL